METDSPTTADSGRLDIAGARRRQIIAAVRRLIATEGVAAVTIARIAALMGTSRGVVNYHFANKEEILRAALLSAGKDASVATDQLVSESQDLESVIALVVGLATKHSESDWWHLYTAFLAEATHDDFAKDMIRATDRNFRAHLTVALGGEARAAFALAVMKGLALQWLVDDDFEASDALRSASGLLSGWSIRSVLRD
jgi:AcrR family transcriptional regulator